MTSSSTRTPWCRLLVLAALLGVHLQRPVAAERAEAVPGAAGLEAMAATAWSEPEASAYQLLVQDHMSEVETALAPLLSSIPQSAEGRWEEVAVKYVLHHFFVRRFSWHVKGLDPAGQRWNATELTSLPALTALPGPLKEALAERFATGGLAESDVATLALCVWHLINWNSREQLVKAYAFLGQSTSSDLPLTDAISTVGWYMTAFLLDQDLAKTPHAQIEQLHGQITELYPRWPQLAEVIEEEVKAVHSQQGGGVMSLAAVELSRERLDERYGSWQVPECRELKQMLLDKEDHGTGRVRLADFYQAGLDGKWQFRESVEWLREMGALEDTASGEPRVIIENYIAGPSNSAGSSPLHDVRCPSECESLLEQLERQVAAPAVAPSRLAELVAALPSSTVAAPRTLSSVQLQRMRTIADENGGEVPMAGRLMALWLHHEYPRECPFPHFAGTTHPVTAAVLSTIGASAAIVESEEHMRGFASREERKSAPVQMAVWQHGEELPVALPQHERPAGFLQVQLCALLVVFALASRQLLCSGRHAAVGWLGPPGKGGRKATAGATQFLV